MKPMKYWPNRNYIDETLILKLNLKLNLTHKTPCKLYQNEPAHDSDDSGDTTGGWDGFLETVKKWPYLQVDPVTLSRFIMEDDAERREKYGKTRTSLAFILSAIGVASKVDYGIIYEWKRECVRA